MSSFHPEEEPESERHFWETEEGANEPFAPSHDQPVHVDGFWFVMKWIFLLLLGFLFSTQLAQLLEFTPRRFLEFPAFTFLLISTLLSSLLLNVIVDLVMRSRNSR